MRVILAATLAAVALAAARKEPKITHKVRWARRAAWLRRDTRGDVSLVTVPTMTGWHVGWACVQVFFDVSIGGGAPQRIVMGLFGKVRPSGGGGGEAYGLTSCPALSAADRT